MKQKTTVVAAAIMISGTALTSCSSVKAYQKSRINDGEMQLSARKIEKGEQNFHAYSEGSSGANGGKAGGGCGCN